MTEANLSTNSRGSLAEQNWHDGADPRILADLIAKPAGDSQPLRLKALDGAAT